MPPHAGVTVRLQLDEHGNRVRGAGLCPRRRADALLDASQTLNVMTDFVRKHIRAREVPFRAEALLELVKETEIEIDLFILRTIERTGRRLREAARGLDRVAEQHRARAFVLWQPLTPVVLDVFH